MFFTMEDRDEEISINADQFGDSFARDTNVEELREVCNLNYLIESWLWD